MTRFLWFWLQFSRTTIVLIALVAFGLIASGNPYAVLLIVTFLALLTVHLWCTSSAEDDIDDHGAAAHTAMMERMIAKGWDPDNGFINPALAPSMA